MLPVPRRPVAWLATVALLLAVAAPAAAAEPPHDVVFDAEVTVLVSGPIEDGVVQPLPGAEVALMAYVNDFPEDPVQELSATTNDGGAAVFGGVARSTPGGPAVYLAIQASRTMVEVIDGCVHTSFWSGSTTDVPSADGAVIGLTTFPGSTLECPPVPVLTGTITGPAGEPVAEAFVSVAVEFLPVGPAIGYPTFVAAGGTFEIELTDWLPLTAAEITVAVATPQTRQATNDEGCVQRFGLAGSAVIERPADATDAFEPLHIATEEVLLSEQCGTVGSPPPPAAPTLPPTDVLAAGPLATGPRAPALSGLIVLALLGVAVVLVATAPRRR